MAKDQNSTSYRTAIKDELIEKLLAGETLCHH